MKKLMTVLIAALCTACVVFGAIDVREVTFPADEIPATNPRIERRGEVVTHIEVFGAFETLPDGSVKTRVAESAIDMDAITAQLWVREAKVAIGAASNRLNCRKSTSPANKNRGTNFKIAINNFSI